MGSAGSKKKEISNKSEEVNFDHFQVLRAIGKGSFGKVCIVQNKETKIMYAMKYMNKAQCNAKDAVHIVFREIEILASLSHPFLVNLWFSFQDEEDMFMVVDLLLGGDLRYHVQRGIQFTDESVRLYIMEVASALDYLHRRRIIHRDIKPDNLLLDEEGHVHLTDFNIATVIKDHHFAVSMSGTKPYMAPEVFETAADACDGYSFSVDWWSLGVTAYEIRKGRRPFDIHSNTALSEIRIMFFSPPKFPSEWGVGLVQLLTKLLTISPASRVSSMESLRRLPYAAELDLHQLRRKEIRPTFTPPKEHLNCDPTFELEEMIIESKPLHKKKKRLLKQRSLREGQNSLSFLQETESVVYEKMPIFNREKEVEKRMKEKREKEWEEELERSMNMSDPIGLGSAFSGSRGNSPTKTHVSENAENYNDMLDTLVTSSSSKSSLASHGKANIVTSIQQIDGDILNNTKNDLPTIGMKQERKSESIHCCSDTSGLSEDSNPSVVENVRSSVSGLLAPSLPSMTGSSEPSPEPTSTSSSTIHSRPSSVPISSSQSSLCSSKAPLPFSHSQSSYPSLIHFRTNSEDLKPTQNFQKIASLESGDKEIALVRPYYALSTCKNRPRSQPCFTLSEHLKKEKSSSTCGKYRRDFQNSDDLINRYQLKEEECDRINLDFIEVARQSTNKCREANRSYSMDEYNSSSGSINSQSGLLQTTKNSENGTVVIHSKETKDANAKTELSAPKD